MTLLFLRLVCRELFPIMRNLKFLLECCPSPSNGLTFCSGSLGLTHDHGHVLLDDKKRQNDFYSGYSIIGRAFGLAQLTGLEIGMGVYGLVIEVGYATLKKVLSYFSMPPGN